MHLLSQVWWVPIWKVPDNCMTAADMVKQQWAGLSASVFNPTKLCLVFTWFSDLQQEKGQKEKLPKNAPHMLCYTIIYTVYTYVHSKMLHFASDAKQCNVMQGPATPMQCDMESATQASGFLPHEPTTDWYLICPIRTCLSTVSLTDGH